MRKSIIRKLAALLDKGRSGCRRRIIREVFVEFFFREPASMERMKCIMVEKSNLRLREKCFPGSLEKFP